MLIFPIFATLVWALAMHWRRQWQSFAAVTGSILFLYLIFRLLYVWQEHLPPLSALAYGELLWPYIGLTGAIGYYICFLPRPPTETQCRKCRYELSGLNPKGLNCPECGQQWRGKGSEFEPPPVELTPILREPPKKRRVL